MIHSFLRIWSHLLKKCLMENLIFCAIDTTWKVSVFGVFLVSIFPHLDWIRRDTEYLTVFSLSHRIQSECGKIWTRKTPNTDTFDAVRCRDTNNLPHNDVSEYKRILFFNLEILILANVNFLVITDFASVQIYYYNKPISIIYVW